jgi:tRNA (guanine37-N1)-methyltransferase
MSLFPEMFAPLKASILARAANAGKIEIEIVNFRDFSSNKHKKADDEAFSPGAGLVLMCQPIYDCVTAVDPNHTAHRIFMTPAAPVLTVKRIEELAKLEHIIILCGHYEGVDQRVIDLCFDEVLSVGDYVLTGGEIPAMVVADAVSRHVGGVINKQSLAEESFSLDGGLLEYPQYTRPREWRGYSVPPALLSGDHAAIKKWKKQASLEITKKFRGQN